MSDTATLAPETESFAAYAARENARERNSEPSDPVEVVSEPKVVDVGDEAVKPTETEAQQPRAEDGKFAAKDQPKLDEPATGDPRKSHQAKISRAIAQQREAERRAEAAEAELAKYRTPAATTPEPVAAKPGTPKYVALIKSIEADPQCPQIEDFTDAGFSDPYAAYNAARSAFIAERVQSEADSSRAAQQAQTREHELLNSIDTQGREKYQDWDTLYQSEAATKLVLQPAVLSELYADPDSSADLIHHVLTHPDDLEALAAVPDDPIAAARTIARLSAGLSAASSGPATVAKPQTKAKPLIKPVSSSPAAPEPSSPEDLQFGPEYIRRMNEKERKAKMNR
jgi:hypothetical protein